MGLIKKIMEATGIFVVFIGIAGITVGATLIGKSLYTKKRHERFVNAALLEGTVVKEEFYQGGYSGGCNAKPESYLMKVELPDGSSRVFEYKGNEAQRRNIEYDVSSPVGFRDGFKPGDSY